MLVAGMIVSSNYSLFLVFHRSVSVIDVSVRVSLSIFGGSDKDDIVVVTRMI